MEIMKIKIELQEELLGTASANPELFVEWIAKKSKDGDKVAEELAALPVEELAQKSMTVFCQDEQGNRILWDYQIKGFFKDACGMLSRVAGTQSKEIKAYKKVIDGLIFPRPRKIPINLPKKGEVGICQRPLRAQTAQGERIALAYSETVPAGSWVECEIALLDKKYKTQVVEWLDYGALRGLGQWRNSGKGRFSWSELKK